MDTINKSNIILHIYEPFSLGRFVTDHYLTKNQNNLLPQIVVESMLLRPSLKFVYFIYLVNNSIDIMSFICYI